MRWKPGIARSHDPVKPVGPAENMWHVGCHAAGFDREYRSGNGLRHAPASIGERKRISMFDDLQERIKRDDDATTARGQRRLRNAFVILLSIVLFGGLYAAIRFMES
jgi:hypothetical protein